MKMILGSQLLELIHLGGERKRVPVISASNTRITIRWEMAGIYDLVVAKNQFVTKSMMYWKAANIKELQDVWQSMRFPTPPNEIEERMIRHIRGMPR